MKTYKDYAIACGDENYDIPDNVGGGFYTVGIECGLNREHPVITVFPAAPDFSASEKWKAQQPEQVVGVPSHPRVRHLASVGECYDWTGLSNTEIMDRIMPV
jgi:hypothetical protein